jgi:PhnB protein
MRIPQGFTTLFPYLFSNDAASYVRFLVDGLGGTEIGRHVAPDGRIVNCQIRFGDTTIMVGDARADYPPSRVSLYLYVADADAAMARALTHGASLEMKVTDKPYGDRQGGIEDPSGNIWWISQRLRDEPYF